MALSDYRLLLDERLRDTASKIGVAEKDRALQEAVKVYSRVRPRERVQTVTGNGVLVTHALATDFEERLSRIISIEYPVDEQDPVYLDEDEYRLYRDPTTSALKLRLVELVLGSGIKAYVNYTARHTVNDAGADTIVVVDREAVASLGAAICLRQLAAHYAQTTDATLSADAVTYRTKSQEYLTLAKELESVFRRHLGIPADDSLVPAASAIGDLDVDIPGGIDRFYHPRRER